MSPTPHTLPIKHAHTGELADAVPRSSHRRVNPLIAQTTAESPLGKVLLARTAHGLAGLWFVSEQKDAPAKLDAPRQDHDPLLQDVLAQLNAYWRHPTGQDHHFDVPLDAHGSPFQEAVWNALLRIPHGSTCSYGAIASELGLPQASRAVGAAVGRNPVSIIIPCHRVIGRSAELTGYSGGMHRKIEIGRASWRER